MKYLLAIITLSFFALANAQMTATFTRTINTICDGGGCDYNGPSILINELMISPSSGDGCLSGTYTGGCRGEWIELYNPDLCQPVDISCYYLGNNTTEGSGGYLIPSGTIIPPGGFCLIRGENAESIPTNSNLLVGNGGNTVQITVPGSLNPSNGVCAGGSRLWFPNAGGWFAFYDRDGVPQDAVGWGSNPNSVANSAGAPCVPTLPGCNNSVTTLASYNDIPSNRKTHIGPGVSGGILQPAPAMGQSFQRATDGGVWNSQGTPTLGTCNATCATVNSSTCDGTATVNVTGGTAPYTYVWNDSQGSLTETATGLCAGTWTVTVTDNTGAVSSFDVVIEDFVPTVTFDMNDTVCLNGSAVTMSGYSPTATAGQTGTFTGTGVTGSAFNPATAGVGNHTITYTFEDEHKCTNSATGTITVNPNPTPTISGIAAEYCLTDTIISPTLTPTGGTLSGPGVSNNQFDVLSAGAGNHTLTYSVTENGCPGSTQVTVNVIGTTPPTFTVQDQICLNASSIPLTGSPSGGIFTIGTQTVTNFDPVTHGEGTHIITYTITNPINSQCSAQTSDTIEVINGAQFTVAIPTLFCYGSPNYFVDIQPTGGVLSGILVIGDSLMIESANPGNYSLTYDYTSPEGCSGTFNHNFTVDNPVGVDFNVVEGCFQELTFTASKLSGSSDLVSYEWYDAGTLIGTGNPFMITEEEVGGHTYNLIAKNATGCATGAYQFIDVKPGISAEDLLIPNVITPNGDGVNDFILFPLMNNDCINYEVLIVNRWGNMVYMADKANPIFDGKAKSGMELSAGVYFYQLLSDDFDCKSEPYKSKCHGFITIVK